jgi:hypothetical protein
VDPVAKLSRLRTAPGPCTSWLVATVSLVAACSSSSYRGTTDSADNACPGMSQQAIVNGSVEESYLGLAPEQIRAIVQVVDGVEGPDAGGPLCSGVFIAPDWVATAGHCLQIQSAAVIVPGGQGLPIVLQVIQSISNPDEDVALLKVDPAAMSDASADAGIGGMAPMPVGDGSVGRLGNGTAVEIAGYGQTEKGTVGSLRFLVESITAIDAASITVSGFGASGGCAGDSGGPLLMRGADGGVRVAGILSIGSATCREDDTYLRLDTIRGWMQEVTGPYVPADPGCGGIVAEGRCLYGSALWCSDAQLSAEVCTGGESCGWDPAQMGYRCVPSGSDPCQGVDSIGVCEAGAARWCNRGALSSESCGCGSCRVDGTSGKPVCGG